MDTIPYFKKVWKTITAQGEEVTVESINEILDLTKGYLKEGILKFKHFTEDSYQKCLRAVKLSQTSDFGRFLHRLSESFNLDCGILWSILCNYLMFEFYGRIEDVEQLLLNQQSANTFMKDLWNFYVTERIFVIKIIRYILEEHQSTSNKFHKEFKRFIEDITYKELQVNFIKQYDELLQDVYKSADYNCPQDFAKRNLNEQLHVLFAILTEMKFYNFTVPDFIKMVRLVRKNNMERLPTNFQAIALEQSDTVHETGIIKAAIILSFFRNLWSNPSIWQSHRSEIDKLIRASTKSEHNSAIILTWTTLQFIEADDYLKRELVEKIIDALNADALVHLYNLVSSEILTDTIGGWILQTSVFKLMDILCIKFGGDKIYIQDGAVLLIGELLKSLELAKLCLCGESLGVKSLYVSAMSLFPHHFQSLTLFMESLISLNYETQLIIDELKSLTIYSKLYSTCLPHLIEDDKLNYPYKPLNNNLVVFPVGTVVSNLENSEQRLLQFHSSYSYFTLLQHIVTQYCQEIENNLKCEENTSNMLRCGYALLLQIIKVDWMLVKNNSEIEDLVLLTVSHLLLTCMKASVKDLEILRLLFEICVHMFKHDPERVISNLQHMMFLPKFVSSDFTKELFTASTFLSSFTLLDLFEEEYSLFQSCEFLKLYLQLIQQALMCNSFLKSIQIPGLMYILQQVFPGVIESSLSPINKQNILVKVMEILYFTLRKNREVLVDDELTLYDGCLEIFISDKIYITHLLNILNCDSTMLQSLLASEIDHKKNLHLDLALLVKCSLYCLWRVLTFIKSKNGCFEEHSYLEAELFSRNVSGVSILKVICGYMNNYYDSEVSVIACNILTAYASLSAKPLLTCLTLDNYQVQSMFLERLRDSGECEDMQVAIIKLIQACIDKQTALTKAFFSEDDADYNIFTILNEFLTNISEIPGIITAPVQQEILNLLHELFVKNKQHLVKKMLKDEKFWVALISTLFKMPNVNIDIYLKLFEIITIELHLNENRNEHLTKALTVLFDSENKFFEIWIKHLSILLENKNAVTIGVVALTVWKKLLRTISRFYKDTFTESWNKSMLGEKCLQVLHVYSKFPSIFDVLTDCIELCLLFPCKIISKVENVNIIKWLYEILTNLVWSYQFLDSYCKTAILTIIARTFKDYRDNSLCIFRKGGPLILKPLLQIFVHEYSVATKENRMNNVTKENDVYSWFLTISLINNLLVEEESSNYESLFVEVNYLRKMLAFVACCVYQPVPLKVVEVSALSIAIYGENILPCNLDRLDLKTIYLETTAPTNYTREDNPEGSVPANFQNFLIIFSYMVRLNQCFLVKNKKNACEVLKFIYIHQVIIVDIMSLTTVQANIWHLKLVVKILHFLYDALRYHEEWIMEDPTSFSNILVAIKQVLNSSIGVILRPKILVCTQDKPNLSKIIVKTDVPERHFINTCDVFIEIITWSCMFFTRCNPTFINLLDMYKPINFSILIESDFRVPPAVNYETKTLSYGGLLCVLRFFCKSLSQISSEEQKGECSELNKSMEKLVDLSTYHTLIHPTNIKETAETINALYRFGIPEMLELPAPWFLRLNSDNLWLGVEAIITLLAGQSFLTINDSTVERTVQRYIRRELCAELRFFYDVIERIVVEKYINKEEKAFGKHKSTNVTEPEWSKINQSCELLLNRTPPVKITDMDDCFLLVVVHWFKNVCGFVLNSTFDEYVSNWHAKSTWVTERNSYVKNTTVDLSDDDN